MSEIMWEPLIQEFLEGLLAGDYDRASTISRKTMQQGATPAEFFLECITPALVEVGNRFETLEICLPEMVIAAEIVRKINDEIVQPLLLEDRGAGGSFRPLGKVVLATIQGDLHDIGKNMVALLLKVNGFEVVDLGINVPPAVIIDRAREEQADIIGMSSLLTTCLPYMKDMVDQLKAGGLRESFAVIIGGAAPTDEFAERIGVDGVGHSAAEAVRMCKAIMGARTTAV